MSFMHDLKEYRRKLEGFNASPKYRDEMEFMIHFIAPSAAERILDFGCGIGTMMNEIKIRSAAQIYGYDKYDYSDGKDQGDIKNKYSFKFDKIYMMHSIAHIENIDFEIGYLSHFLNQNGSVYVMTPNRMWLAGQRTRGYDPDKTVVQHYNQDEITDIFEANAYRIDMIGQFGR